MLHIESVPRKVQYAIKYRTRGVMREGQIGFSAWQSYVLAKEGGDIDILGLDIVTNTNRMALLINGEPWRDAFGEKVAYLRGISYEMPYRIVGVSQHIENRHGDTIMGIPMRRPSKFLLATTTLAWRGLNIEDSSVRSDLYIQFKGIWHLLISAQASFEDPLSLYRYLTVWKSASLKSQLFLDRQAEANCLYEFNHDLAASMILQS